MHHLNIPISRLLIALSFIFLSGKPNDINGENIISGSAILEMEGDIAAEMVRGIDAFLLNKLKEAGDTRFEKWHRRLDDHDHDNLKDLDNVLEEQRQNLSLRLGVVDERRSYKAPLVRTPEGKFNPAIDMDGCRIITIEWPVVGEVFSIGYMVIPENDFLAWKGGKSIFTAASDNRKALIIIPDAGQSGESILGLDGGKDNTSDILALCRAGVWIFVPHTISRDKEHRQSEYGGPSSQLTHREYLHRAAFSMGRTLAGYEIQSVLAIVDWLEFLGSEMNPTWIGVIGYGEGGMISMYAGALDERINMAGVSGYYSTGADRWKSPLDRNIFGIFEEFGDAETGVLLWPRRLIIECESQPGKILRIPGDGGAPSEIVMPAALDSRDEWKRLSSYTSKLGKSHASFHQLSDSELPFEKIFHLLEEEFGISWNSESEKLSTIQDSGDTYLARNETMIKRWDNYTQKLLADSPWVRSEFMSDLDSTSMENFVESASTYREIFKNKIIGSFEDMLLPMNVRTRLKYEKPGWKGWEVVLDVYPEVIAYGILCIPDDIDTGGKRPVVVCQHGLEGRPQDIIEGDHDAYHDFAARLTERGYITFSPQNPYIFKDDFRTLQRKANLIGKSLFSIITPQHRQILNWLKTLPYVDAERIAFYGLSYGGKTAMRVPAIIEDYCLSICSADFNDWVWKNASTKSPYSYVWTGEYEIFEFNLGHTFNYSDMAALIAPRPFMVERGHYDGVAPDHMVASEFAKVRYLYQARLNIGERCRIEWFPGPHTINGKGTFEFLDQFLKE